jgi:hypothetical protein
MNNNVEEALRKSKKFCEELIACIQSQSYDWRFADNQFVLATSPLRLTTSNFIFQLNTCGSSPYVTPPLTRVWVCRSQFLLVLASAVILRSECRRTHDQMLLSQIRDPHQPGEPGPRIYIHGTGCPSYTACIPFTAYWVFDTTRTA